MSSHNNFRVTVRSEKGDRHYMEDEYAVHFEEKDIENGTMVDMEFGYFGIFDGHGGPEASKFTRDNLLKEIKSREGFWSDNDDDILQAIREGFLATHHAMWNELPKWPKRSNIHPSTAGTTASIAILKKNKLYVGHVGDSGIVLAEDVGQKIGAVDLSPKSLTKDHKPDSPDELKRIQSMGGKVANKAGVQRVVWHRPKAPHHGPIRRSTPIDEIPFLAVARSLGDLWSHNPLTDQYAVSPEPDLSVIELDPSRHRFLVLGSDGLWNMISPTEAVHKVGKTERLQAVAAFEMDYEEVCRESPSNVLVTHALQRWRQRGLRADNITCLTVMLDPPGQSFDDVIRRRRKINFTRPPYLYEELPVDKQDDTWELVARYAGYYNAVEQKYNRLGTLPTPPPERSSSSPEDGAKSVADTAKAKRIWRRFAAKKVKRLDLVQRRVTLHLGSERRNYTEYKRKCRPRSLSAPMCTNIRDKRHGVKKPHTTSVPSLPGWLQPHTGPGKVMIARARDINATPPPEMYLLQKKKLLMGGNLPKAASKPGEQTSCKKNEEPIKIAAAKAGVTQPQNLQAPLPGGASGKGQADSLPGVCTPPSTPKIGADGENLGADCDALNQPSGGKPSSRLHNSSLPEPPDSPEIRPGFLRSSGYDVAREGERVLAEMRKFRYELMEKQKSEMENRKTLPLKKQVNGIDGLQYTNLKRKRTRSQSPVEAKSRKMGSKSCKETYNKILRRTSQRVCKTCA